MKKQTTKSMCTSSGWRLTQADAEKISAVEGLVLSPQMRNVLSSTVGQPAEMRCAAVRAHFAKKFA